MRRLAASIGCVALLVSSTAVGAHQQADGPALATPRAITGSDVASRTLYLTLIENLRSSGQIHAALAHLDAFDRQFPRSAEALLLRGNCLVDVARYSEAATVFRQLQRGPQAAAAAAGLGRIEALGERWAAAATHYARAVQLAPTTANYLSDFGFVLLRGGRASDAVFRLRQAVELDPGNAQARNNLILALAASGDEPAARRLLTSIADADERAEVEAELWKARTAAATPAG